MLLDSMVLEFTSREYKFLEEEKNFFEKIGFIYDDFGNNSIVFRAIPYINDSDTIKNVFSEILDYAMEFNKTDKNVVSEKVLHKLACKSAIKANMKLHEIEILNILNELDSIKNPYTCPHGRPTIIKMFKRIV